MAFVAVGAVVPQATTAAMSVRRRAGYRRRAQRSWVRAVGEGGGEAKKASASKQRPKILPRLFVLELEQFVKQPAPSEPDEEQVKSFVERVHVHAKTNPNEPIHVMYATRKGYSEAMEWIGWDADAPPEDSGKDAIVPLPDTLVCLSGLQIFQRGYRTPDPYWDSQVMKKFESKPARYVVERFYEKELRPITAPDDDVSLRFARILGADGEPVLGKSSEVLCAEVEKSLDEMGLVCRVESDDKNQEISVMPGSGSLPDAVAFIQGMLRVLPGRTLVFGRSRDFKELMTTRANLGVFCEAPEDNPTVRAASVFR